MGCHPFNRTMERSRYKGSDDELRQAIMPFASSQSFVQFHETEDLMKLKVARDMKTVIEDHAGLLGAIHGLQPNLRFPSKVMQAALEAVLVGRRLGPGHKAPQGLGQKHHGQVAKSA